LQSFQQPLFLQIISEPLEAQLNGAIKLARVAAAAKTRREQRPYL